MLSGVVVSLCVNGLKCLTVYAACLAALFACAPQGGGAGAARQLVDSARFAAAPAPPRLAAASRAEVAEAAAGVAHLTAEAALERRGARLIEVSEIPYLRASAVGAGFLAGATPRALARGEPPASCPAAAAATGATSRPEAARAALQGCFDRLEARGASPACGCRIAALDNILLDRRESFAFAPAVSAHLIGQTAADRAPTLLVAEALPSEDGAERVLLRDAGGEVGRIVLAGETAALTLAAAPDRRYVGDRRPFGFRRGRIAERLSLTDQDGRRLDVLIGVEERDVFSQ